MSLSRRVVHALWRQQANVRGFLLGERIVGVSQGVAPVRAFITATDVVRRSSAMPNARSWEAMIKRGLSTAPEDKEGSADQQQAASDSSPDSASKHEEELLAQLQGMTTEKLHEHIVEIKKELDEKEAHIAEMKDRLVRTLADMENLRDRTGKQLEEARKYATQGLVKSLVEVADNLERAAASVVKEVDAAELDVEKALGLLHGLKDGVVMTDGILMKILEKEGVKRYDPSGDSFDPNLHDALFEVPPSGDAKPGTVAVVVKKGYLMHDRAVRAAEVGVVKGE